ncbi:MAG: zinc ribbon domain-containing protein, partial [Sphaerospermopsis sp.]|nr:zinc ribbon domain-containing protein [Sphaerospermopsis sp.]
CKGFEGYTGKSVHFLGFQEMAKKFSNLLLTPDSYALTERLSQQPLDSFLVLKQRNSVVKKETLSLSERVFKCDNCGFEFDRNLNAVIILLKTIS